MNGLHVHVTSAKARPIGEFVSSSGGCFATADQNINDTWTFIIDSAISSLKQCLNSVEKC